MKFPIKLNRAGWRFLPKKLEYGYRECAKAADPIHQSYPRRLNKGAARPQRRLDSYFSRAASFWESIYSKRDLSAFVHQERLRIVLGFADIFAAAGAIRVLDIGCGAGRASVALARSGRRVYALDPVLEMLRLSRRAALASGVHGRVTVVGGDVHDLPFPPATFDLIIAAGVLPWLRSKEQALQEIFRVLRPGGYLIVNVDNRWAFFEFFDPLTNPFVQPVKDLIRKLNSSLDNSTPHVHRISIRHFRRLLDFSGFVRHDEIALGFGPLTFFRRNVLPQRTSFWLHQRLQSLVDRNWPLVRSAGSQLLCVAEKPVSDRKPNKFDRQSNLRL